eukprot:gene31303-20224_t
MPLQASDGVVPDTALSRSGYGALSQPPSGGGLGTVAGTVVPPHTLPTDTPHLHPDLQQQPVPPWGPDPAAAAAAAAAHGHRHQP